MRAPGEYIYFVVAEPYIRGSVAAFLIVFILSCVFLLLWLYLKK